MAVNGRQEEREEERRKRQMMGTWEWVLSVMGAGIGDVDKNTDKDWEGRTGVDKERRLMDMLGMGSEARKKAGWDCYHQF